MASRGERNGRYGARKIGAKNCEQKKFTLRFHSRLFGEIGSQVSFGQQVGKERRYAPTYRAHRRHQPAGLSFERQAQCRPILIVNVSLFE